MNSDPLTAIWKTYKLTKDRLRVVKRLELAAHRAIEVFKHFQALGIDLTRHIMSATSFGEYKPVQRQGSDMYYNSRKLKRDNNASKKREKNRKIEVVLIYRRTY